MTEIQDIIKQGTQDTLAQLQALHERIQSIAREFDGLSDEVSLVHIELDDLDIGEPELQGLRLLNRVRLLGRSYVERRVLLERIESQAQRIYFGGKEIECRFCGMHAVNWSDVVHVPWCAFDSEEWSRFDGSRKDG
jgi:hypothetical protein